ncbi:hypothetical protein [Pseudonocardia sp. KRD291]|uniref:hypothetical protein n=1 Tax=Pseudonocardia sp. KRD291 TaxID=2792007 RepID=UPI001C4A6C76|nr:hypothetical protein [Pseudonocardia sp. KRD291]MBW0101640.1 hypothetical protein [Pseudonocardia sp. KRD291]
MTPGGDIEFARAETVTALVGQLDGIRRDLAAATRTAAGAAEATAGVADVAARADEARTRAGEAATRVDDLARTVAQLSDAVTALAQKPRSDPAPTWMLLPVDPAAAAEVLDGLAGWMTRVYLRYSDAAASLPECWCWHPDVVEELLWLMHAWIGAYQGQKASVAAAADWHDRHRPGVVRRIEARAGTCSRERHQFREGWTTAPSGAPVVPAEGELRLIAGWWGSDRDRPAPEPPPRRPRPLQRPGPPGRSRTA